MTQQARVPTPVCVIRVYTQGYPGTYPSIPWWYLDTYPEYIYPGGTRIPTRVYPAGTYLGTYRVYPGCTLVLPEYDQQT